MLGAHPERVVDALLPTLDDGARITLQRELVAWDAPEALPLLQRALDRADLETRHFWLTCFLARGGDPGTEAIAAALDADDPELRILGLRLLAAGPGDTTLRSRVDGLLFSSDLRLRTQAVEAGLRFANQSAWLICKQLSRSADP
ncbi:MAG: hypothetical protein KC431_24935, partial [Myxococcales bacterium]|nr:hypothetical protein [Myxococcales bacterium]